MFPSKAIFVQIALMASAYRLFCIASARIGLSSSIAVFWQSFVPGFIDLLPVEGDCGGDEGHRGRDQGGGFEFGDEHGVEGCFC